MVASWVTLNHSHVMAGKADPFVDLGCRHLDEGDQAFLINIVLRWIRGFAVEFGWEEEFTTSHQILLVLDRGCLSLHDE